MEEIFANNTIIANLTDGGTRVIYRWEHYHCTTVSRHHKELIAGYEKITYGHEFYSCRIDEDANIRIFEGDQLEPITLDDCYSIFLGTRTSQMEELLCWNNLWEQDIESLTICIGRKYVDKNCCELEDYQDYKINSTSAEEWSNKSEEERELLRAEYN